MSGQLIVFEGPDGTGKSSLIDALFANLKERGKNVEQDWFPGRRPKTLGELVYRLHHEKETLGVDAFTPTSLQTMHIAAHLDLIERYIKPYLATGGTLLLDRYWWSTWVYGLTFGVREDVLKGLVLAEQALWDEVKPSAVFLIERETSLKNENLSLWQQLRKKYSDLLETEKLQYPCFMVSNDESFEEAFQQILKLVDNNINLG